MNRMAVIGATGMLGAPVTRELHKAGFKVRALVRNMDKAMDILPRHIEKVQADVRDINRLEKTLAGIQYLYVSLSTIPSEHTRSFKTETDGLHNVIKASQRAGIQRIGYLSSMVKDYKGTDWWVFDIKREAVRLLRNSEIPSTVFYPSNFYENLPCQQLRSNRILLGGDQKTKSWWIGSEDYGKQVARSFHIMEDRHEDREYSIQGPEPFNFEEAADIFIQNYPHRKLRKLKVPLGVLKLFGRFSREVKFSAKILDAINHYDEQFQSEQTWNELGAPRLTLAEFSSSL